MSNLFMYAVAVVYTLIIILCAVGLIMLTVILLKKSKNKHNQFYRKKKKHYRFSGYNIFAKRKSSRNRKYYIPHTISPKIEKAKLAKQKGALGEAWVTKELGKNQEYIRYTINDVILPDGKGGSKQIDHIHINENGIFVIETKNWSGKIYGNEHSEYWTCNQQKYYNPIKQNKGHVALIKELLNTEKIQSYVVFVNSESDLHNVIGADVITLDVLKQAVNHNTKYKLDPYEIKKYYEDIMRLKTETNISEQEHIRNVKRKQGDLNLESNLYFTNKNTP